MRTLARWEPTTEISHFGRGIDRLFEELLGRSMLRPVSSGAVRGNWTPAVDILEKEDRIEILSDLPGFRAEDVEVTVEDGVLTIRGERKFEEASEGETYHKVERSYGLFERTFTLPNSVDMGKIAARFADGEMRVVLPKREETKPRSVKVKVEKN
jgi:HSP20 family protein